MIEFKKTVDTKNKFDISEVSMKIPSGLTIDEVLEEFDGFLRAIGYVFDGTIEVVVEEQHASEE